MQKKPLVQEIYFMRALAMFGVIAVHGTSFATVDLAGNSDLFWIYQTLNRFGKWGTPVFIFLSSFVLFYNYVDRPLDSSLIKKFYTRRFHYIFIPYFFWSLFYFIVNGLYMDHFLNDHPWFSFFSIKDLVMDLLFGKAHAHLYFVVINVQFYVLFPLFLWFMNRYKPFGKHLLWGGVVLQWSFFWIYNFWLSRFAMEHHIVLYKASIFLSYMVYFGLGAFVGTHFERFQTWIRKRTVHTIVWTLWLTSGIFYTWLYYRANVYGIWLHSFWYEFSWNVYTTVSCLALFHVSYMMNVLSPKLKFLLTRIGGVTFGIYLIHPFVLFIWRLLPFSNHILVYHVKVWFGMAAALFISWAVVEMVRRISPKLYGGIFGQWAVPERQVVMSDKTKKV